LVLSRLSSPLAIGPVELPNRIVSTAHQTTLVHEHLPTDDFVAYHEARARGGVGLIVLEATAIHESGLLTSHTLGGYLPDIVEGYRRVAAAVRPHGTRLFVQLFHGGREQIASAPRSPALAPSAVPSARFRTEPRAARAHELEEIVAGFAVGAELAAAGGLDGVEVSAAHRYLIEQLFDPALNRREDEWGQGDVFLRSVLRAIRAAAPGLALGARVSGDSGYAPSIAKVAVSEGIDYVSVALGESSTYLGSVGIVPPPPVSEDAVAEHASAFRLGPPVVATSRVVDPERAEAILEAAVADAVGMTRALIADPDLPQKAFGGETRRVLACIGCNACIAHYHAGTPIGCTVNPRTGRELTLPPRGRAAIPGRVVVAGGGPAGLQAAADAAEMGHEVVLLECRDRLGGQLLLSERTPGGAEVARRFLDLLDRRIADGGVQVELSTKVTAEAVAALEPAFVIAATGAAPYVVDLPLLGVEVMQAWALLAGDVPAARRVVVADWGGDPSGLDAAELLAAAGNTVTLTVASVTLGETVHQYRRNLYLQRLYRAGVEMLSHRELIGASDGVVELRNVFARELHEYVEADLLVLAQGRIPVDDLAPSLRALGLVVEEVGDCLSPRSLEEATLEASLAVRRLSAVA
jgi:2,4-dienoyl-CoA reductase-like NADH-dependent reductase (Old Yellow Enzyme family)/thioredoxin reductase